MASFDTALYPTVFASYLTVIIKGLDGKDTDLYFVKLGLIVLSFLINVRGLGPIGDISGIVCRCPFPQYRDFCCFALKCSWPACCSLHITARVTGPCDRFPLFGHYLAFLRPALLQMGRYRSWRWCMDARPASLRRRLVTLLVHHAGNLGSCCVQHCACVLANIT